VFDGEHIWEPIFGLDTPGLVISNSSIVNHCIEVAEPIKLFRNAACDRNGGEIPDNHRLHLRRGFSGALGPVLVPRVQDDVPCSRGATGRPSVQAQWTILK
jgi:hypothetical protein